MYDVIIIGGGPAGLTAGLYCGRAGLSTLVLEGGAFGGQMTLSSEIENYPAFPEGIGGEELSALMRTQAERFGAELRREKAKAIDLAAKTVLTRKGEYTAKNIILAMGASPRPLGVPGESEYRGAGVSYCAVCDGALYRGKKIAAVVTSPVFAEEVEYLAGFADTVYAFCLYEGATFRDPKIEVRRGAPRSIEGAGHVERIAAEGEALAVSGVFFLRSAIPPDSLVGGLKTDGAHIVVGRDLSTNLRGLFAAGDVTGLPYQYAKAAGEGLVAAHSVKKYLNGR